MAKKRVKKAAKKVAKKTAKKTTKKATRRASSKVDPIPKGFHTVTPSFVVQGCAKAIDFLKAAFGAKVNDLYQGPDGSVMHAELTIGDSKIMCGEPMGTPPWPLHASLYVKDCEAVFAQAVAAGASVKQPLTDQFYGDRSGRLTDPFGNEWVIATHVENVSREEMNRRMQEMMSQGQPPPPPADATNGSPDMTVN